jgi:hypothetical protein
LLELGNCRSEIFVDGSDGFVLEEPLVPLIELRPSLDVQLVDFQVGRLVEDQQVSNGQVVSANVRLSLSQIGLQDVHSLGRLVLQLLELAGQNFGLIPQCLRLETHDMDESGPESSLVPGEVLSDQGSLLDGLASILTEFCWVGLTEVAQDGVAFSEVQVPINQTGHSSKGIDGQVLRRLLLSFQEVDNLGLILDVTKAQQGLDGSAGLA